MITTAIWLGSIDGSREIVKERAVLERERAVGVRLGTYPSGPRPSSCSLSSLSSAWCWSRSSSRCDRYMSPGVPTRWSCWFWR